MAEALLEGPRSTLTADLDTRVPRLGLLYNSAKLGTRTSSLLHCHAGERLGRPGVTGGSVADVLAARFKRARESH